MIINSVKVVPIIVKFATKKIKEFAFSVKKVKEDYQFPLQIVPVNKGIMITEQAKIAKNVQFLPVKYVKTMVIVQNVWINPYFHLIVLTAIKRKMVISFKKLKNKMEPS